MLIYGRIVRLRGIDVPDLPYLMKWHNDPVVAGSLGGWSFPIGLPEQNKWFERILADQSNKRFIIETLRDARPIGMVGLWGIDWVNRGAESGLLIGEPVRGQGYGTDAVFSIMRFAFEEIGLHRLWAEIADFNAASLRVYVDKCGWVREGLLRQKLFRHGSRHDVVLVSVLADEYWASDRVARWKEGTAIG